MEWKQSRSLTTVGKGLKIWLIKIQPLVKNQKTTLLYIYSSEGNVLLEKILYSGLFCKDCSYACGKRTQGRGKSAFRLKKNQTTNHSNQQRKKDEKVNYPTLHSSQRKTAEQSCWPKWKKKRVLEYHCWFI